jgi:MSHA biogenesis protein MshN
VVDGFRAVAGWRKYWLDVFQMSLINQMLQDLDSRGTESVGTGALYSQIRSVPDVSKRRSLLWLWWVLLPIVAVSTFAVWQWMHHSEKALPPSKPVVQIQPQISPAMSMGLKLSSALNPAQLQDLPATGEDASVGTGDNNQEQPHAAPASDVSADSRSPGSGEHEFGKLPAMAPQKESHHVTAPSAAVIAMQTTPAVSAQPSLADTVTRKPSDPEPATLTKQFTELSPQQRAENEYRKALALIQQGKQQEAIAGLEHALQMDRQHVSARQTLAGLLIDAKHTDEAMQKLQEGLTLDPSQSGLAMILARLQLDKGDVHHAIETLQRTLPYAADLADYQAFLAALFQRDGKQKDAVDHYVMALRQNPQNGVWWMGLGISLQAENRLQEALEAFGRAKASNALSPELLAFVDQKINQLKH